MEELSAEECYFVVSKKAPKDSIPKHGGKLGPPTYKVQFMPPLMPGVS